MSENPEDKPEDEQPNEVRPIKNKIHLKNPVPREI